MSTTDERVYQRYRVNMNVNGMRRGEIVEIVADDWRPQIAAGYLTAEPTPTAFDAAESIRPAAVDESGPDVWQLRSRVSGFWWVNVDDGREVGPFEDRPSARDARGPDGDEEPEITGDDDGDEAEPFDGPAEQVGGAMFGVPGPVE